MFRIWGYDVNVYHSDRKGGYWRCSLGMDLGAPLIVIGLNPSTANDEKPDHTIRRIQEYACWHGYRGFIMLNLFAQRALYPKNLPDRPLAALHKKNVATIMRIFEKRENIDVLAVWGENIKLRTYLSDALQDIMKIAAAKNVTWLKIGPSLTQTGHPRHPSRGAYQPLYTFDIDKYYNTHFR